MSTSDAYRDILKRRSSEKRGSKQLQLLILSQILHGFNNFFPALNEDITQIQCNLSKPNPEEKQQKTV